MAFTTTETSVTLVSGPANAPMIITGTYASTAGDSGGIIAAGYTNASGVLTAISPATGSIGGRFIKYITFTPTASDATQVGAAITYNTTIDAQIATMISVANSTGTYMMICDNAGA